MDGVREFLDDLKRKGQAQGNFLGLLHVLIGRHIARADGRIIANGLTWREVAAWLKKVRWPKEAAQELGIDSARLPPRDRERFWYLAIAHSRIDSDQAIQAGDRLAQTVVAEGYTIGPAPRRQSVSH